MAALLAALRIGIAVAAFVFSYRIYRSVQSARSQQTNAVNYDCESSNICLLCHSKFDSFARKQMLTLPCKHKFHKHCIDEVIKNEQIGKRICPLCLQEISEDFIKKSF